MDPPAMVRVWLKALPGCPEADGFVTEYIAGALSVCGEDDGDEALSDLDAALQELCVEYGGMDEGARLERLSALFGQVQDYLKALDKPEENEKSTAFALTETGSRPGSGQPSQDMSISNTSESGASKEEEDHAAVEQILALCSGQIGKPFAADLLGRFNGSLQATADYVLETEDIQQEETMFKQHRENVAEQRRQDEVTNEKNRQAIIARFALQEVKVTAHANKKSTKDNITPALWAKADHPKYRFVDGIAVQVKKGQKYVVEKTKEEWDGGSKGKVYTKGKRGKGFS